eukprot:2509483-Pyramimonas_sp.AAC.1
MEYPTKRPPIPVTGTLPMQSKSRVPRLRRRGAAWWISTVRGGGLCLPWWSHGFVGACPSRT